MKSAIELQAYNDAAGFVTNIIVYSFAVLLILALFELLIVYIKRKKKYDRYPYREF